MPRELVPELHDVLKITKWNHLDVIENPEKHEGFPHELWPKTATGEGMKKHHIKELFYPDSPETLTLCIADNRASSFSRGREISGIPHWSVLKLWNPSDATDQRLDRAQPTYGLLKFLQSDPSWSEALRQYEQQFMARSEDAHPGRCITTLHTHSTLTGKFYRILWNAYGRKLPTKQFENCTFNDVRSIQKRLEETDWKLKVSCVRVRLPQTPVRAKDWNIFRVLQEAREHLSQRIGDNILLATPEEFLVIGTGDEALDQLRDYYFNYGIRLEVRSVEKPLRELAPALPEKVTPLYEAPETPSEIRLPICEICQSAPAAHKWSPAEEEESTAEEDLCDACYRVRQLGSALGKLQHWTKGDVSRLLWFSFRLDYDKLTLSLRELYLSHLKQYAPSTDESKAEIRFSVISEFQWDLEKFYEDLSEKLNAAFGRDNVQKILDDFYCIPLLDGSETTKMLRICQDLMQRHFPKFLTTAQCPLGLSIVQSGIKLPVFEVWRLIENPLDEISIHIVGSGRLKTKMANLPQLVAATGARFRKNALQKLAEVAKISEALARLEFERKDDRDSPTYQTIRKFALPMGLDFQSILTLAKILKILEEKRG